MAEFALVRLADNAVEEFRVFDETPPDVSRKGIRWRPVQVTDPPCNPMSEVREGPVVTMEGDGVALRWTVRAMTPQELAVAQEAKLTAAMGSVGVPVLLDVVNAARAAGGQEPLDETAFKAQLLERIG